MGAGQTPGLLSMVHVTIYSEAPVGASTGTSAAVTVAPVGVLDYLTLARLARHETANVAHSVEADMLKQQSGIQDQLRSAYGGINYTELFQYPYALISQIEVPNVIWWGVEWQLTLVCLGKLHYLSQTHEKVIVDLERAGPNCC